LPFFFTIAMIYECLYVHRICLMVFENCYKLQSCVSVTG